MIIHKEDLINEINRANTITLVYYLSPSTYPLVLSLSELKNKRVKLYRKTSKSIPKDSKMKNSDLILIVGIHSIPYKIQSKDNVIIVDDTLSEGVFDPRTKYYISSRKNYAKSRTTSMSQLACDIWDDISLEKRLLMLIGDRHENKELGITGFAKKISDEFEYAPNLIEKFRPYSIFEFSTFSNFCELNLDGERSPNKVDLYKFIKYFDVPTDELIDKLKDEFENQRILRRIHKIAKMNFTLDDLLYAPSYNSMSLDEMDVTLGRYFRRFLSKKALLAPLKINFWKNIPEEVKKDVMKLKSIMMANLDLYNHSKIINYKVGRLNLYSVNVSRKGNFGSRWTWLFFLPWNSILFEYLHESSKTRLKFFSKSYLHAGEIAILTPAYSEWEYNISGNGKLFRASLDIDKKTNPSIVKPVIKSILGDIRDQNDVDIYSSYWSQVNGEPIAVISDSVVDIYKPFSSPKYDVKDSEFKKFKRIYTPEIIEINA